MKRSVAVILLLCLCLCLHGCGKSDEAKKAEELILAIGEITLESETSILTAQGYYDTLSEEQKQEVENYALLLAAHEQLELAKKAETLQQANTLFEQRDYKAALQIYEELGDFENAAEMVTECNRKLAPLSVILEYVDENSVYLSDLKIDGVSVNIQDDVLTVLTRQYKSLKFILEIGSPIVDWKSMDLTEFHNYNLYQKPDKILTYKIGDYYFNYIKLEISMHEASGSATCNIEYIETYNQGRLRTGSGKSDFNYTKYSGDASFLQDKGFNTDATMLTERSNEIINVSLEYFTRVLKECGLESDLEALGWKLVS